MARDGAGEHQKNHEMLKKSPVYVMTVRELAAFLNVHPGTVYALPPEVTYRDSNSAAVGLLVPPT